MALKDHSFEGGDLPICPDLNGDPKARPAPSPKSALAASLAALATMDRDGLVAEWRRQFRSNPPERIRRDLLELGIAWKLQEKAFGGLKKAIASQLRDLTETLARTGDVGGTKLPRLKPGVRIVREWGGVTHEVTVTESGFLWNGKTWASLSAIAGEITGAHWSGPRFFGLAAKTARAGKNSKSKVGDA